MDPMRLKHVPMILVSGSIWLAMGVFLLAKGLSLLALSTSVEVAPPFVASLMTIVGSREQSVLLLISLGLLLGFIKGRFILSKAVARIAGRIFSLPAPVAFREVYGLRELVLIGSMMLLGMLMRWLSLGVDVRGVIDVTIGSALINGSILFFRQALAYKQTS